MPPHDTRHADILHYQCIRRNLLKDRKPFDGGVELGVCQQRVERHIDLAPLCARICHEVGEFSRRKVHGLGACGKRVQAKIHRIRTGLESGEGRLERPGRSQ